MHLPLAVAITGASGAIYGVELLKALKDLGRPAHLVISHAGQRTLELETDLRLADVQALAARVYGVDDLAAPLASGSFQTAGLAVVPCSIKTLSAIAHSYDHNLIARAGDVCLKERRKLVLVV
ncbi:MAG: UbiX family flavin prenyltransferase, partial [Desulfarculus sp.]|nr:UbiX family flavin prenyltransferase [Desulfarculus sp.]